MNSFDRGVPITLCGKEESRTHGNGFKFDEKPDSTETGKTDLLTACWIRGPG